MTSQLGALLPANVPEFLGALDRLQYRERVKSAQLAFSDLRERGMVPMLVSLGTRFGVANRALLGV